LRAFIGIDVSKDTLDVCLLKESGKPAFKQFRNDACGFAKLLRWSVNLTPLPKHFCMEATGPYSQELALFLSEAGELVSMENPRRIKHYGIGLGIQNKTDHADAYLIASFCQKHEPAPFRLASPEVRELIGLLRRLDAVETHRHQEHNRLKQPGLTKEVIRSLKSSISFLEKECRRLKDQIQQHVDNHPKLKADRDLLTGIPGIGDTTAYWLLAELGDVSLFPDAKSAAAFAGLNPCVYTSGTSVRKRTRISKTGNVYLRRALYMPAMVAARYNPLVRDLYERMTKAGKHKMVALAAAMRKLLMIAYGVLKNQKEFSAEPAAEAA